MSEAPKYVGSFHNDKEKRRNGYTAIYTRKLLLKLVTHIYQIGITRMFEEYYLFGPLVREERDL